MKNYKFTIAYDGTRYHGWEAKKEVETIEGKIENVLAKMCGEPVNLNGAGRTDAGVHAQAMVANGAFDTTFSTREIQDYLNRYLPDDISIEEVREASDRFHARLNAVGKWYRYVCYDGPSKPIFDRKYVTVLGQSGTRQSEPAQSGRKNQAANQTDSKQTGAGFRVDIPKMQKAAEYLIGEHDFKSFCGNPKMKKSTVRQVDEIKITRRGGYIYFDYHGKGFLQNMVRILTGTLLEVGYGRKKPEDMVEILEALDRSKAGPTAPAQGLCLMEVKY